MAWSTVEVCDKRADDQTNTVGWYRLVIFAEGVQLGPHIGNTEHAVVAGGQSARGLAITRQNP